MPRLIPPELGNGTRPGVPKHGSGTVPVLDVSADTHDLVADQHAAALDPKEDAQVLLGVVLIIDNPRPRGAPDTPGRTVFSIGGSTLHEAATEVVGALAEHALDMPEWVASSDPDLADVIAEHYTIKGYSTCKVISLDEVPS